MPEVSVLMPVRNGEAFLAEAVESVLAQTFSDFELIVIDDASTDTTAQMLNEFALRDSRVRIIRNEENLGIPRSRNKLLLGRSPDSQFVALMDADDICFPDRLQRQLDFLKSHPEIGALGSSLEIIDEHSRTIGFRHYPTSATAIRRILPGCNVLAQPAMMLRSKMTEHVGLYALDFPVCSDYEYWLRALPDFSFANLAEPVLRYRLSGKQCKQKKLKQSLSATLRIQRNYIRRNHRYPLSAFLRHMIGYGLLLLPDRIILFLFQFLSFRKPTGI